MDPGTVLLPVALLGGVLTVVDERLVELPQALIATLDLAWTPAPDIPRAVPLKVRVSVASSAASEVTWRSVRSDIVARVRWGLPENIAADIRLVGPWRSLSALVMGLYGLRHA